MNPQAQCPRCGSPRTALDARFCQICGARLSSQEPQTDPLLGSVLLGRYKVVSLLGEGGMGRVYLAEQKLGEATRRVAIKVLASSRGNDAYVIARFRREASTIATLTHPNTIRIYDYGEENGMFFSVMEYVGGGSLAELLARGPIDPTRAERVAWQVAGALDEAHRAGIVHRDLKPENILLARGPGGAEIAKVVDFGIARRPPEQPGEKPLTVTGAVLGTPSFMSPEQFRGEAVDSRSDVYALALVFFQMVSGALPWKASSVIEWADRHMNQSPRTLGSLPQCEAFAARYDPALAHGLHKDRRKRTPDALTLVRELSGSSSAPEAPPAPQKLLEVTLPGGPGGQRIQSLAAVAERDSEPSPGPSPRRRASPGVLLFFALACVLFGYVAVRWALEQQSGASVVVAPRDASSPDEAVVHRPDGGPRVLHSPQRLLELRRSARNINNLESVLVQYRQLLDSPRYSDAELQPLRADIVGTAITEIRWLITSRNCIKAQGIGRKLDRVGLLGSAAQAFTRACPAPRQSSSPQ